MKKEPTYEEIKQALIDVLDGNQKWYDIQGETGLDESRCREIESLYYRLINDN